MGFNPEMTRTKKPNRSGHNGLEKATIADGFTVTNGSDNPLTGIRKFPLGPADITECAGTCHGPLRALSHSGAQVSWGVGNDANYGGIYVERY